MTAAAIAAQLVDMRNVGTHKVLKLTIHVPEEQALEAIAAFGWPTGVSPVPIAIARLNSSGAGERTARQLTSLENETAIRSPGGGHEVKSDNSPKHDDIETAAVAGKPEPERPRRQVFREMRLANQAGMLCNELPFQRFLIERLKLPKTAQIEAIQAADYVRHLCKVASRSDIRPRTPSGDRWTRLVDEYRTWMHSPELVG